MGNSQTPGTSRALGQACSIKGCLEDAFAIDEATGVGYCPEHLEAMIDRWEATAINPSLRETLPPIEHRHFTPETHRP